MHTGDAAGLDPGTCQLVPGTPQLPSTGKEASRGLLGPAVQEGPGPAVIQGHRSGVGPAALGVSWAENGVSRERLPGRSPERPGRGSTCRGVGQAGARESRPLACSRLCFLPQPAVPGGRADVSWAVPASVWFSVVFSSHQHRPLAPPARVGGVGPVTDARCGGTGSGFQGLFWGELWGPCQP